MNRLPNFDDFPTHIVICNLAKNWLKRRKKIHNEFFTFYLNHWIYLDCLAFGMHLCRLFRFRRKKEPIIMVKKTIRSIIIMMLFWHSNLIFFFYFPFKPIFIQPTIDLALIYFPDVMWPFLPRQLSVGIDYHHECNKNKNIQLFVSVSYSVFHWKKTQMVYHCFDDSRVSAYNTPVQCCDW